MLHMENDFAGKTVLILNRPNVITDNNFYVDIFHIPEVLNRLRQYREVLTQSQMNIPVWVYCLTQKVDSLLGTPQPLVLNFLINLGLFDRYVARKGWPEYIVGSNFLMSVIASEIPFEEQVLLLANGYSQSVSELHLYEARSFYNPKTGSFCLISLKQKERNFSLKKILLNLKKENTKNKEFSDWVFQLLSPHDEGFVDDLCSYGLFSKEFLEWDQDLKWLWPIWKKTQMQYSRKRPAQIS